MAEAFPTHRQKHQLSLYKGEAAMWIAAFTLALFTGAMLFTLLRVIWETKW